MQSPALRPFLPLHPNNIGAAPLKNLAHACQPESRTAKLCRLPAPERDRFEIWRSAICRRCFVFTASKSQEPPATPQDPKPVLTWNAPASSLPLVLRSSPPARIMRLTALCTTHISAIRAQSCTNEKSRRMPRPRITMPNHYYFVHLLPPGSCV